MSTNRKLLYVGITVLGLGLAALGVEAIRHRRAIMLGVKVADGVEKTRDAYQQTLFTVYEASEGLLTVANGLRSHYQQIAAAPSAKDPQQAATANVMLEKYKSAHNLVATKYNAWMIKTHWILCDPRTLPPGAKTPLPISIELIP